MAAPTALARVPRLQRLLLAVVFAVAGFVAVWQGFGLAGFGTDFHPRRAFAALVPLFLCGLLVVWPRKWLVVRVIAVVVGGFVAGYAWWEVRPANHKSAMSLREAVQAHAYYKERLSIRTAEEAEKSDGLRGAAALWEQYPSLCADGPAEHDRWAGAVADDITSRYKNLPPDDFKGAEALRAPAKALGAAHPASAGQLGAARRQWVSDAIGAKTNELRKLAPGDWDGFNSTSFGRYVLVDALPDTRDTLARAETDWVDASVESVVANRLTPKAGEPAPTRALWKQIHWELLTLKSIDTADGRFAKARGRLFKVAHDGAKADALAHFEAGRADRALEIAIDHAVSWTVTAATLGEPELHTLAEFRATYEFLAALESKGVPQLEVAPPPRPRP